MTTPTTPGNSLSVSQVSDEINPAGYVQGQQAVGANVVVRRLTGSFTKNRFSVGNPLEIGADLSNKVAFSGILVTNSSGGVIANTSNTQQDIASFAPSRPILFDTIGGPLGDRRYVSYGDLDEFGSLIYVPEPEPNTDGGVTSVLTLTANTDMFEPNINWTFTINPGSNNVTNGDISITKNIVVNNQTGRPYSKSANVKLTSLSGTKTANLTITGVMTVANYDDQGLVISQHIVNTCSNTINLTVNTVNTAFQVTATPAFTVNATGVIAQTATIIVKASANNLLNQSFVFKPTFISGTGPLTPVTGAISPAEGTDTWNAGLSYNTAAVPSDFNWIGYLYHPTNPDLLVAGLDTRIEAERHYVLFGQSEGRQYYSYNPSFSDTIIFTATAATPLVNSAVYNLLTEFYSNGKLVGTNTSIIDIKAQYTDRQITSLTPTALSNNQFSNSTSQYSTIDITAIHNSVAPTYPQGTITFTLETTGDSVTQQTLSSNSSAKVERISLYHNKDADGFGFKKATVVVVATLKTPDNVIVDQKRSQPITLRAGTYGLSFTQPPSNTQVGYSAQTATSTGSASWGAGTFAWTVRQFNGTGPQVTQDNQPKTSTISIVAKTPTGKNASQTVTNTCNYDLTGTLSYDGITIETKTLSDILVRAQSLPYTYSLSSPATSNIQFEPLSGATASLLITGTASVGTITWSRDNAATGLSTTSTTANVFVTSTSGGGSNNQTVSVTGALYDASSRLIESQSTQNLNIDATTAALQIIGANVSVSSEQSIAAATGVYDSTAVAGIHSLRFPPVLLSGDSLQVNQESPTKITIVATATQSQPSKTGNYRITAQSLYRDIIKTITKDVTVSIGATVPTLTVTKHPYTYSTYSEIGSITGFGGEISGGIGSIGYYTFTGVDLVAETDYSGTINTNYTITRVVNILGDNPNTVLLSGPFYNQAASLPTVNTVTGLPTGYPSSINKRRDRVESTLLTVGSLKYNITYELRDASNRVLVTTTVSDDSTVTPPTTGQVRLDFVSGTNAVLTVTNKPNNGFGYPEPNPLEVISAQTINYSATYSSTGAIPTPRFVFSFPNRPGDNVNATRVINANTINGQANVTVSSVYNDTGPSIVDGNGLNSIQVQLTSTDPITGQIYFLGEPKALTDRYTVLMPPGRCYRLSTFTYGPRMYHTRDVFGNSSEQIDYNRIPSSSSLSGPETKFLGFHDGSTIYALESRPLYSTNTKSATRYYSSTGHRSAHGNETPNVIIPTGYFMIMSFAETGAPSLGAITFIGSDNKTYPCGALWAKSLTTQNDTSRDNDAFDWFIYEPPVLPAGVTASYVFISNGGYIPPPPAADNILFTAVAPGNAYVGQNLNLNIGTVSGGLIEEDSFVDPGNIV